MVNERCKWCGSNNILICRTLNNEIIYIICKNCNLDTVVNKKMYKEMEDLTEKDVKELIEGLK